MGVDAVALLDEEVGAPVSKFLKKVLKTQGASLEQGLSPAQVEAVFQELYSHINAEPPAAAMRKLQESTKKAAKGGSISAEVFADIFRGTKFFELLEKKRHPACEEAFWGRCSAGHAGGVLRAVRQSWHSEPHRRDLGRGVFRAGAAVVQGLGSG
eukprot:RCo002609